MEAVTAAVRAARSGEAMTRAAATVMEAVTAAVRAARSGEAMTRAAATVMEVATAAARVASKGGRLENSTAARTLVQELGWRGHWVVGKILWPEWGKSEKL
jgi:hypothetical protein